VAVRPDGARLRQQPGLTVFFAVITAIAGLLGVCATIFGITDLCMRFGHERRGLIEQIALNYLEPAAPLRRGPQP
jgi:hypothetical protein